MEGRRTRTFYEMQIALALTGAHRRRQDIYSMHRAERPSAQEHAYAEIPYHIVRI